MFISTLFNNTKFDVLIVVIMGAWNRPCIERDYLQVALFYPKTSFRNLLDRAFRCISITLKIMMCFLVYKNVFFFFFIFI